MKDYSYQKRQNAGMDNDFQQSMQYGKIKLGQEYLFWRKNLKWNVISLSDIQRAYRRVEEVTARTCCASSDFSIHKLLLTLKNGSILELMIGDDFHRREPERLMEQLHSTRPEIILGKF